MTTENARELLKEHKKCENRIKWLKYELAVMEKNEIETIAFAHGDGVGRTVGTVADRTFDAVSYYKERAAANSDGFAKELKDLMERQDRLKHYIDLLDDEQAQIIKWRYFEKTKLKDIEDELHISESTLRRRTKDAIEKLVEMYNDYEQMSGKV